MYEYFNKNHKRLSKEVEKNPRKVASELRRNSTWGYDEFNPRNMRKGYIRKVVKGRVLRHTRKNSLTTQIHVCIIYGAC